MSANDTNTLQSVGSYVACYGINNLIKKKKKK